MLWSWYSWMTKMMMVWWLPEEKFLWRKYNITFKESTTYRFPTNNMNRWPSPKKMLIWVKFIRIGDISKTNIHVKNRELFETNQSENSPLGTGMDFRGTLWNRWSRRAVDCSRPVLIPTYWSRDDQAVRSGVFGSLRRAVSGWPPFLVPLRFRRFSPQRWKFRCPGINYRKWHAEKFLLCMLSGENWKEFRIGKERKILSDRLKRVDFFSNRL